MVTRQIFNTIRDFLISLHIHIIRWWKIILQCKDLIYKFLVLARLCSIYMYIKFEILISAYCKIRNKWTSNETVLVVYWYWKYFTVILISMGWHWNFIVLGCTMPPSRLICIITTITSNNKEISLVVISITPRLY